MLRFSHVLTKFKTFAALIFEKRALKTQISMNLYAEKSKRTYDLAAGYPLTLSAHFNCSGLRRLGKPSWLGTPGVFNPIFCTFLRDDSTPFERQWALSFGVGITCCLKMPLSFETQQLPTPTFFMQTLHPALYTLHPHPGIHSQNRKNANEIKYKITTPNS